MKLNDVINELLKKEGYKQVDLARKLNKPRSTISERISKGDIDEEMVGTLSEMLKIPKDDLLEIFTRKSDQNLLKNDVIRNKITILEEENNRLKEEIEKLKSLEPSINLLNERITHYQEVIKYKDATISEKESIIKNQQIIIEQNLEIAERMKDKATKMK